jgi:hypothetical protein
MDSSTVRRHITKEWAVVSPHAYVGKSEKASGNVSRKDAVKVRIVDTDNMYRQGQQSKDLTREFIVADKNDRTRGFLVQVVEPEVDRYGDGLVDFRFVARATEFIGVYTEMEAKWVEDEARQAAWQAKQEARSKIQTDAVGRLKVTIPETEENLKQSLVDLLGTSDQCSVNISVGGTWNADETAFDAHLKGTVSVDFYAFQRLLETVYEARELADQLREGVNA